MTAQSALAAALERKPPPAGGFSPAILRLEVRRLLRNRRTMVLALVLPVLFFWGFGLNSSYVHESAGHGNVSAVEMISIALYGAVSATATCGAMVSIERTAGWSRQLRVTPLSPGAYVVIKMLTSLVLAAGAVAAVYLVGAVTHKVSMPADLWVITGLCVWIGSLLFAAFGLFTGYLLPSENVTQVIGLVLTLCAFAGGLLIPFSQFSPDLQTFARFTPLYGLSQLVHYPLVGGTLQWGWILNLAVWLAIFVAGAVWSLRRDTARVLSGPGWFPSSTTCQRPSGSSSAAATSYPSAIATSGAAATTRPSPATGTIASSTSAISSSLAPAASARPAHHSRQTAGDPSATDPPSRSSAVVLGSRTDVPASPIPAWSSTKPSSIIASLRNVSWNLTVRSICLRPLPCHHSTSPRGEFHPPDGVKAGSSPSRSPSSRDRATAWLREAAPSFR
jgi:ABC-2 type transport system permease protein